MSLQFHNRTLERMHRLGPYKQGKTRTVVARFANYKDKMLVLQLRNKLKEHHKIYFSDDLPSIVEAKCKGLYPVYIALRSLQHQRTDGFVKSVKLISDKLWLNGTSYTPEDLGRLPDNVSLDKLFNPCDKGITAFFRKFSKLSNHYPCTFVVKGDCYSSMEKYLMSSKADFFMVIRSWSIRLHMRIILLSSRSWVVVSKIMTRWHDKMKLSVSYMRAFWPNSA